MAFTLGNRFQIPRHPTPGSQYERVKFELGGVYTILPPVGKTLVNVQGVDVPVEGKKLQVTKELVALIQAGFVRIANDIDNTGSSEQVHPSTFSQQEGDGDSKEVSSLLPSIESPLGAGNNEDVLEVSSHDLAGGNSPASFSSREEVRECQDRERLRLYVLDKSGLPNLKTPIENIRDIAEGIFMRGR